MTFVPGYAEFVPPGASPSRTVFLLHGIMGSQRNWRGFAGRFVKHFPGWRVVVVDLRHHGASRGARPPDDLAACVSDLENLGHATTPPHAIIGHSFGGKVALAYAERHRESLAATWVLDCPPGAESDRTHTEVGRVIEVLRGIAMPVARRAVVARQLAEAGFSPALSGWMTTNLRRHGDAGFRWHFDLDGVAALLDDYWRQDLHRVFTPDPVSPRVDVVYAADSDRWRSDQLERLRALAAQDRVRLHRLEGAGHWVHIDNPEGLLALLGRTFAEDAP